jgi:hypothetical protein
MVEPAVLYESVLVGPMFETFLSNRLSPKQETETAQQPAARHATAGKEGGLRTVAIQLAPSPSAHAAAGPTIPQ